MKDFKVIPLLVAVALLSFSVRLVDVVSGVSTLSGSAQAESPAAKDEMTEAAKDESMEMTDAEATSEEDGEMAEEEAMDEPEWRDPVDDDPAYEAVRMDVFKDLSKRRKEIEAKERALTTREALLKAAEQELDRKYQELSQLRGEIEGLLQEQSEEELSRIRSLVKIYEGMKPKDAARIFDTLDLDILAAVVSKMSERKLSPVMAAMNPERARTITIMLAEQKTLPSLPQGN